MKQGQVIGKLKHVILLLIEQMLGGLLDDGRKTIYRFLERWERFGDGLHACIERWWYAEKTLDDV